MAGSGAALLGALLRFADPSGTALELEVELARSATVAVVWGDADPARSGPARRHRLGPWPVPRGSALRYRVAVHGGSFLEAEVPDFSERPLRVAVIGPTGRDGGGAGPTAELARQIRAWRPHALLPLGSLEEARTLGPIAPRVVFEGPRAVPYLRLGPAILAEASGEADVEAELRRLRAVFADSDLRIVAMERGPLGSGPSPRRPEDRRWVEGLVALDATLVVSARDRLYERLGRGRTAFVTAGAGGARIDARSRAVPGSAGVVSTPSWVALRMGEDGVALAAHSLDGLLLDRTRLPPERPYRTAGRRLGVVLALGALGLGLLLVLGRILWSR